jgi:hypothetical protein
MIGSRFQPRCFLRRLGLGLHLGLVLGLHLGLGGPGSAVNPRRLQRTTRLTYTCHPATARSYQTSLEVGLALESASAGSLKTHFESPTSNAVEHPRSGRVTTKSTGAVIDRIPDRISGHTTFQCCKFDSVHGRLRDAITTCNRRNPDISFNAAQDLSHAGLLGAITPGVLL